MSLEVQEVSLKIQEKSQSPELSIHSEIKEPEINSKSEPEKKDKLIELYSNFRKNYPTWDLYMICESFIFLLSFLFWVGESQDKDIRGPDSAYLYTLNTILMIDFLFRMLSIKIESIKREYWNHVLHCIVPLIMWLLSAYYKFDEVFGSNAIQVLNALLFIIMNLFVLIIIILKFFSINKIKSLFSKKNEIPKNNNIEENNIV